MKYFMGIDVGTSSVKALIVDEFGAVAGFTQRGYEIKKNQYEYAEQDMDLIWSRTKEAISSLVKDCPAVAKNILGVGFSGQMHGLVIVDSKGNLVRDAIIWADQRSEKAISQIYKAIPEEDYRKITRNSLSTGFMVSSLIWLREQEPENFKRAYKIMLPKDYIRYRMSGVMSTDMSDASGTVIFDTGKREWAWGLIDRLGLERELFPECTESSERVGVITAECEGLTGLKAGTSVVCGGGDTPMQALGNGMIAPGTLASNIGTASQISSILNKPLYDRQFRTNTFCHVKEDTWMIMGANLSGGVALQWLKNQILLMDSFDEMTAMAQGVPPGSDGLLFLPYLNGERTPYNDPNAKGIYLGLTLKHTRAHMIRSTMEGIVFGLKNSIRIFENLDIRFDKIIASGGGARSRLFLELQADIFNKEIYTSAVREQACAGAAVTAAVGVGAFYNYEEACESMVHLNPEVFLPDSERSKQYAERFLVFQRIYEQNKELF